MQLMNAMSETPTRIRTKAWHQSDGLMFSLLAFVLVSHFAKERNVSLSTYASVPCLIKENPCSAEFMTVSLHSRKRIIGVYNYQRSTQALKSKEKERQNRDRRTARASERESESESEYLLSPYNCTRKFVLRCTVVNACVCGCMCVCVCVCVCVHLAHS